MVSNPKRVTLNADVDLRDVVCDVHRDKVPRIIEQGGEDVAVVVDPVEYRRLTSGLGQPQDREAILALAGAWAGLVDADELIDDIEHGRQEAPISSPVELTCQADPSKESRSEVRTGE